MVVLLTLLVIDKIDSHFEEEREQKVHFVCVTTVGEDGEISKECNIK